MIINNENLIQSALKSLISNGFIILRTSYNYDPSKLDLDILLEHKLPSEKLYLLQKPSQISFKSSINVDESFGWITNLQELIKTEPNVVLFAQNELSGVLGLFNCLKKEPGYENVRLVFSFDENVPTFSLCEEFYMKQLKKGLSVNVFKDGEWGMLFL